MTAFLLQLLLLMSVAFFIGAALACLLRRTLAQNVRKCLSQLKRVLRHRSRVRWTRYLNTLTAQLLSQQLRRLLQLLLPLLHLVVRRLGRAALMKRFQVRVH
jgi:hypothetical protein